jgi:opacity protein-like surface antigen
MSSSDDAMTLHPIDGLGTHSFGVQHRLTSMAALRGKLGYTIGEGLLFATGGMALGTQENDIVVQPENRDQSDRQTVTGWTVGAGFAYKLTENISVQSEYSYTDFGQDELYSRTYTDPVQASARLTAEGDVHQVRFGLNFHF